MNEEKPAMEVEEAIIDLIRTRREVGRKKYGVSMERGDLSISQWITHATEESLDFAIYLEAARRKIVEQDAEIADLRAKLAAIQKAMGHPATKTLTVGELKMARKARQPRSEPCCECGADYPHADLIAGHIYCSKCRRTPDEIDRLQRSVVGCCDNHANQNACICMEISKSIHGTGCSICNNPRCDNPGGKH